MIQDIFEVSKHIFELSPQLSQKRKDERIKLANLLELIGYMVEDTTHRLRNGHLPVPQPHAHLRLQPQAIEKLSEELYFRLAYALGEIKAHTLASKLRNAYVLEQIKRELDESQSSHHHLTLLDDASGYLMATSHHLRTANIKRND